MQPCAIPHGAALQAFDDLDMVLASSHLSTISEVDPKKRLALALENMATATPAREFAGQYVLLNERVSAGQGLVNFARSWCDSPPSSTMHTAPYVAHACLRKANLLLLCMCAPVSRRAPRR